MEGMRFATTEELNKPFEGFEITAREVRTVFEVFSELASMPDRELNKIVGSLTIPEIHTLYTKIKYWDYCKRHGIRFEDMTDDDFESAALE